MFVIPWDRILLQSASPFPLADRKVCDQASEAAGAADQVKGSCGDIAQTALGEEAASGGAAWLLLGASLARV